VCRDGISTRIGPRHKTSRAETVCPDVRNVALAKAASSVIAKHSKASDRGLTARANSLAVIESSERPDVEYRAFITTETNSSPDTTRAFVYRPEYQRQFLSHQLTVGLRHVTQRELYIRLLRVTQPDCAETI